MTSEMIRRHYEDCTLCPRQCHANRFERSGFCGAGVLPMLARAALHLWEEPCISGTKGSGAVFFSHCTLRCIFCQNHEISAGGYGKEISVEALADTFLRLQSEGAENINLVTATQYLPSVLAALDLCRDRLKLPVVYNCGGYESVETLRRLEGYVDIYLPDFKYADDALAYEYSGAPGYRETAAAAIREMIRQTGAPVFSSPEEKTDRNTGSASASDNPRELAGSNERTASDQKRAMPGTEAGRAQEELPSEAALIKKGVIVRHMVLPGQRQDSIRALRLLKEMLPEGQFLISLLSQYTPFYKIVSDPQYHRLNRRITSFEYDSVVREAVRLGFQGYMQEKSSAKEEYTPSFHLEGVP